MFQSTRDGNDEIYRLDLETGQTIRLTDHPASDAQPSWSPDGSKIVFVSDRDRDTYSGRAAYQLYIMDSDGSDPRRLTETEWADFMPRWSPDGQWITFLSDRRGSTELYLMSSDGGDARPDVVKGHDDRAEAELRRHGCARAAAGRYAGRSLR